MAGRSNHHNEKMAVYNSVDQVVDDRNKKDMARDDMDSNFHRSSMKLKPGDTVPKKKSFEITGVVVAKVALDHGVEECDSMDDVDETGETQTEDVSSDILDLSKITDIEHDPSSAEDISPNLEEPPRDPNRNINDMTSRFKVVKIETREPFKRGRWTCLDFLDPATEKLDRGTDEAGSGNSSNASSIHYVPGIDDPGKNPFVANVVYAEGFTIHEPQAVLPSLSTQGVSVVQNGDYTPASMMSTNEISNPPNNTVLPSQPVQDSVGQSQPTSLINPLPSQPKSTAPTPSQPATLPSTLISSQNPANTDYSQNQYPAAENIAPKSQATNNGHIPPAQVNSTQNYDQNAVVPPENVAPRTPKVNVTKKQSSTDVPSNQSDFAVTNQDYVQTAKQDYLPSGQEYVQATSGKDSAFLPPPQSSKLKEFNQPTPTEAVSHQEPKATIVSHPPNTSKSNYDYDYPGAPATQSQNSKSSSVPKSIKSKPVVTQGADYSSTLVPSTIAVDSENASPNNENVQSTDKVPPLTKKIHRVCTTEDLGNKLIALDSLPTEREDDSKGASAPPPEGKDAPATPTQSILTPPLLEMVATMNAGSIGDPTDGGESGASTVAIDNKIEQAMDLVKSHLMYAVREEVEVLKEQIKELLEKNSQLEYENSILKAAASPDTITELQQRTQQQQQQQQQQQTQAPPSSTS